ncbi:translation elongation factor Ts [bacterium]|nr:translation elongation factor Ts [bacterium]
MAYAPKPDEIKELRRITGAGMLDCKKTLVETEGDVNNATDILRKKGLAVAAKKSARTASMGLITSYIHLGGKVGVLVEINCETDFVAKTDEFKELTKEIAMQIAAANPLYIKKEDIPEDFLNREKDVQIDRLKQEGDKPENILEKIVEGRMKKFYSEICLLEQAYIKDDSKSIQDVLNDTIAKLGENIVISKFARFQIGD